MTARHVVLINPKMCSPRSVRLPLSLLSLAAPLETRHEYTLLDGNVDPRATQRAVDVISDRPDALVAVTVMPGPQVAPAIAVSRSIRAAHPDVPIVWGGYFPTLYPAAAINAPYVDAVVRGQGETTLLELADRLDHPHADLTGVAGVTWKPDGDVRHNPDRAFEHPDTFGDYPYHRLDDVGRYLRPSFLGTRTAVHQAALGCRYRCSFCGVVSMFNGYTELEGVDRLDRALTTLRTHYGANAVQFYDHNFFDREDTSVPVLETVARHAMPWWCYARADTLAGFSDGTWGLIRKSRLRMAYIGAEAASDDVLTGMKKGTRVDHTLRVAERCREYGVIPEFSFVLGGPDDPEGEIRRTLGFIKTLKKIHPQCEIILYYYSPTPQRDRAAARANPGRARIPVLDRYGPDGPSLPTTPEEWTEPRWIDYVCHRNAPWLDRRTRRQVEEFGIVLQSRYPTVQDHETPAWAKAFLRALAGWRFASGVHRFPLELQLARRLIRLRVPQREGL